MKKEKLLALKKECENCRACPLGGQDFIDRDGGHYFKNCFSNLNSEANVMVVCGSPGLVEIKMGQGPMSGKLGEIFDEYFSEVGLTRKDVYLTNAVKCLCEKEERYQIPKMRNCSFILDAEIEIIQPKLIVAMGSLAMSFLTGLRSFADNYGVVVNSTKYECPVFVTAAPSRYFSENPDAKAKFLKTMQSLEALVWELKLVPEANSFCW